MSLQETEAKISKLIFDLFVNRNDAYAEGYLTKDKTRMGYRKKDSEITPEVINEHLEGKRTLGVYQLKGTKVKWGCYDFDQNTEQDFENAKKLYDFLKEQGLHPLMEKSGGGRYKCHIWIFLM